MGVSEPRRGLTRKQTLRGLFVADVPIERVRRWDLRTELNAVRGELRIEESNDCPKPVKLLLGLKKKQKNKSMS